MMTLYHPSFDQPNSGVKNIPGFNTIFWKQACFSIIVIFHISKDLRFNFMLVNRLKADWGLRDLDLESIHKSSSSKIFSGNTKLTISRVSSGSALKHCS